MEIQEIEQEIYDERFAICFYDGNCDIAEADELAKEAVDVWRKNNNSDRAL